MAGVGMMSLAMTVVADDLAMTGVAMMSLAMAVVAVLLVNAATSGSMSSPFLIFGAEIISLLNFRS